jgi:hypothetical protein
MILKLCKKCNCEFPASVKYFYYKQASKKDGLNNICKKCSSEQNEKYKERLQKYYESKKTEGYWKEYIKLYQKDRYKNDEEYRNKILERNRKYRNKKKREKNKFVLILK